MTPGTKLGPYEIVALIGAGGMGEVYRARDTKLKREVALKVLPEAFAGDPERMARFQREAEVLASLNHPNIASIYGVEERALVMELVEGESPQGPLPFEEAWKIAAQIADALDYAHERGIVHRDLKPANVKVTPDGVVKLLDFGLAKAFTGPAAVSANPENSPTLTLGATQLGVILGTAGYMAPEQAKGKTVDKRADIWSFGVVLYELLTGERLFQGEDVSDTLAQVLTKEPDLTRAPVQGRKMLGRCLEKDPKKRLRDIGEARYLIESGTESPAQAASLPHRVWPAAAALLIAAAVVSMLYLREGAPEARVVTTSLEPPPGATFDLRRNTPALSPDGRWLAFAARGPDGKNQLWVRPLATDTAQPLAGTDGARFPFWSPDSRSVGFFADGKLKRIDRTGGPVLPIADAPTPRGGSWSAQGVIVFGGMFAGPLLRVPEGGGTAAPATPPAAPGLGFRHSPWFLPDGRHFLFHEGQSLEVGSLGSQQVRTIGPVTSNAVYAAGYLLYLRENALMAQPFDEKRLVVTGAAVPVAGQVASMFASGTVVGAFSVSREGLLIYQAGAGGQQLTWFDRSGKASGTLGDTGDFVSLIFSPGGQSALLTRRAPAGDDLWIYDLARGIPTRFTTGAPSGDAIWSPDGKTVLYTSGGTLYRKAVDGTGDRERLYSDGVVKLATSWSRDGKWVLYSRADPKTLSDIWVMPMTPGPPMPRRWLGTSFNESLARFSPDGHWVAYQSDESGNYEIYVASFSGPGTRQRISQGGGTIPRWPADDKEIFYVGANGKLTATEIALKGTTLTVGATHGLDVPGGLYDVTADGRRFLVAVPVEQTATVPFTLVQNWPELLKKK